MFVFLLPPVPPTLKMGLTFPLAATPGSTGVSGQNTYTAATGLSRIMQSDVVSYIRSILGVLEFGLY